MKSFITIFALVAVVAADVSHLVRSPEADAQVLRQDADVLPDQYQYAYETSNGIAAQESGQLKNAGRFSMSLNKVNIWKWGLNKYYRYYNSDDLDKNEDEAIEVQGSNQYTAPDGTPIQITYVANEYGYQPQGAHLPTTPAPQPIPEYIARAIEYIRTHPPKPEPNQRF